MKRCKIGGEMGCNDKILDFIESLNDANFRAQLGVKRYKSSTV